MAITSPALEALNAAGVAHDVVEIGRVGSIEEAAAAAGVDVAAFAKTLVVRVEQGSYVLVCVPGAARLDYGSLRTLLGVRRLTMPDADEALAATGYARGTITAWGAGGWPVIVDESLVGLERVTLGSGVRGHAVALTGADLVASSGATVASVALSDPPPAP